MRTISYVILLFLAIYIGASSRVVALEFTTNTTQEISGKDTDLGVSFKASLVPGDKVVIDVYTTSKKRIHADLDYNLDKFAIRSFSQANGAPIGLSVKDIGAFQKLLASVPPQVNTGSRVGDAFTSFLNLMASAPAEVAIDFGSPVSSPEGAAPPPPSFTSICPIIGKDGVAHYILNGTAHNDKVTVGPVCYKPPALGRCGSEAGPDHNIGLVQRFTQECLNHDQCCVKAGFQVIGGVTICGDFFHQKCLPELARSVPGFFNAPDCGTTAGNWTDNFGYKYVISGGDSRGAPERFSGTVGVVSCGIWPILGTRTGKHLSFDAKNIIIPTSCAKSFTYAGDYTDCNKANGLWVSSAKRHGKWSWIRTKDVPRR